MTEQEESISQLRNLCSYLKCKRDFFPSKQSIASLASLTLLGLSNVVLSPRTLAQSSGAREAKQQQKVRQMLDPAKTWLFAVGILKFSDGRANASFGLENRRDSQIVALFRHRGVPKSHIDFIKDEDGTITNIKSELKSFLDGTQKGDFLIHYYTGHGGVGSFETTNGGSYNHEWIANQIDERFKGEQVLLLGDCCDSGSLEDIVKKAKGTIAYACISSSSRSESGHGNWTFSQAILDGLRGKSYVDLNRDGYITVDEIAKHVQREIGDYEDNHSIYAKTPNFNGQLIIATASPTNTTRPEPVEVWYKGEWWKARLLERSGEQARIRWIQLGYDSPDQDEWVAADAIRPIGSNQ
jgi:hypothetical protein